MILVIRKLFQSYNMAMKATLTSCFLSCIGQSMMYELFILMLLGGLEEQ